jgi:S-DNA-T family DNA segregation ATPase FtsK/SpoIIIE
VQLATPTTGSLVDDVARVAEALREALDRTTGSAGARGRGPWRIAALPERVELDELPPARDTLWIGIGGDTATPSALPLGPGGRVLVAGPSRSGRSSTLATIGHQLLEQGRPVTVVSPRRSALSTWAAIRDCPALTQQDAADLVRTRQDDPDLCLLVDDAELVDGSPAEAALLEAARLVDGTDGVVVVGAELTRANAAFRGLVPEVARDGVGILLGATSPGDGDVLGVRLDVEATRRPGRGHLVVDGRATPLQVALLDPERCRRPDSPPTTARALPLS